MTIYKPYTYLIGWSNYNIWYYGVEYAKVVRTANPDNLWKVYFTSSNYVSIARIVFGEPDIIEIRRVFKTAKQARRCENKVLSKIDARHKPNWLNATNGDVHSYCNTGRKYSPRTETWREKQRLSQTGKKRPVTANIKHAASIRGNNNPNAKSVTDGVAIFDTIYDMSVKYGVCIKTINRRIKRGIYSYVGTPGEIRTPVFNSATDNRVET